MRSAIWRTSSRADALCSRHGRSEWTGRTDPAYATDLEACRQSVRNVREAVVDASRGIRPGSEAQGPLDGMARAANDFLSSSRRDPDGYRVELHALRSELIAALGRTQQDGRWRTARARKPWSREAAVGLGEHLLNEPVVTHSLGLRRPATSVIAECLRVQATIPKNTAVQRFFGVSPLGRRPALVRRRARRARGRATARGARARMVRAALGAGRYRGE